MLLKRRPDYISLNNNQKLCLVSELHIIRESLQKKKQTKIRKARKPRKMRKPTLLSERVLKIFDSLPEDSKRLVLYGK